MMDQITTPIDADRLLRLEAAMARGRSRARRAGAPERWQAALRSRLVREVVARSGISTADAERALDKHLACRGGSPLRAIEHLVFVLRAAEFAGETKAMDAALQAARKDAEE